MKLAQIGKRREREKLGLAHRQHLRTLLVHLIADFVLNARVPYVAFQGRFNFESYDANNFGWISGILISSLFLVSKIT